MTACKQTPCSYTESESQGKDRILPLKGYGRGEQI